MAKKYFVPILMVILVLSACAPNRHVPKMEELEQQGEDYQKIAEDKTVRVLPEHYVGVKRVPFRNNDAPILKSRVTLRTRGSLHSVADRIMELVPVTVNVASDHDAKAREEKIPEISNPNPQEEIALAALLAAEASSASLPGDAPKRLNINYEGRLAGLLDQISMQSGYGWDYDRSKNSIVFARTMIRTFTLTAAPGKISYKAQLTNKSKESSSSGTISDSVNSTVTSGDTSSQSSQTYTSDLNHNIWEDTLKAVNSMLSSIGKASSNVAAGTITVRDRPENLRQIGNFINELNERYSRQVALKVNVYSLEVTDDRSVGIDLLAMFTNKDVAIAAGSLTGTPGAIGTASATIVKGDLKGSQGVLKALREWGNAKQITSSGIVAMNNQPAPVEALKKIAYLAGSSTETTDYGQTTELTPGEVTTGFSMTVTPHILPNRRVILQYNVKLSSLEAMQTYGTADVEIQLPQVATRAFSQRASMMMGQTLVLAGFEQATHNDDRSAGLFSAGKGDSFLRTLLVITIQVENASPEVATEDI